jgi:hypothetical protein
LRVGASPIIEDLKEQVENLKQGHETKLCMGIYVNAKVSVLVQCWQCLDQGPNASANSASNPLKQKLVWLSQVTSGWAFLGSSQLSVLLSTFCY